MITIAHIQKPGLHPGLVWRALARLRGWCANRHSVNRIIDAHRTGCSPTSVNPDGSSEMSRPCQILDDTGEAASIDKAADLDRMLKERPFGAPPPKTQTNSR